MGHTDAIKLPRNRTWLKAEVLAIQRKTAGVAAWLYRGFPKILPSRVSCSIATSVITHREYLPFFGSLNGPLLSYRCPRVLHNVAVMPRCPIYCPSLHPLIVLGATHCLPKFLANSPSKGLREYFRRPFITHYFPRHAQSPSLRWDDLLRKRVPPPSNALLSVRHMSSRYIYFMRNGRRRVFSSRPSKWPSKG